MSKKRIIAGIVAIVFAIALTTLVVVEWNRQACGTESLVAACILYPSLVACVWASIDAQLKEREML